MLQVSVSGYYEWVHRPESERSRGNRKLLEDIRIVHKKSRKTYGVNRVHAALKRKGKLCSRNRVARLMRDNGIQSKRRRKFKAATNSKHNYPVAPNLLDRNFTVEALNKVWVNDITYIPTDEGWLYLSTVQDLCGRGIVGWSMGEDLSRKLVMDALRMAVERRKPGEGLIHHSDRGSQYASNEYRELLKDYGMVCSMSRKGNCWDNAVAESFYSALKMELIHHKRYRTREEARRDIFDYIEIFYNRQRLHSQLGYKTPAEHEAAVLRKAA
jgi:putative transposase